MSAKGRREDEGGILAWGAPVILAPIALGILGFFWATYSDLTNIKAGEGFRNDRINRLEQSYSSDIKRMESKIDRMADYLMGPQERGAPRKFSKPNRRRD